VILNSQDLVQIDTRAEFVLSDHRAHGGGVVGGGLGSYPGTALALLAGAAALAPIIVLSSSDF
jgi:hypothetical protein